MEVKRRNYCWKCFRAKAACLCQLVKPFNSPFELLILMHPKEWKREKVGTGRLAHLSIKNSSILMGINFNDDLQLQEYLNNDDYYPMVLYPGHESLNISDPLINSFPWEGKKLLLIVIDGTWCHAKKMMRESTILHNLPRLSFDANIRSQFSIKTQPDAMAISTIESIYQVMENWDNKNISPISSDYQNLMKVLQGLVQFQLECAADPNRQSYRRGKSLPADREKPPRPVSRSFFYLDK